VIRKVKYAAIRHFGKKNLKVGHAGTLDPLATGVLLVCIGKATKLAETLQSHDKEYIAGVTFGATTPSYDLEKEIDRFFPHEHITAEAIKEALPAFIGEQDQVAPLFSAKSVDGVRAYELARKLHAQGKTLDEAAQELIRVARINISELELKEYAAGSGFENRATPLAAGVVSGQQTAQWAFAASSPERSGGVSEANVRKPSSCNLGEEILPSSNASSRINVTDNSALGLPKAEIRMACSKGTYVRAFARDLGEKLGSGAHLDSLQRSRSGQFRVENALTVEQVMAILQNCNQ
jgi:tRNA pseudouridine55 synthase